MRDQSPTWESKNQKYLTTLVDLIREMKETVRKTKRGKCMLVYKIGEKPNVQRLYERSRNAFFLPKGLENNARELMLRNMEDRLGDVLSSCSGFSPD